MFITDIIIIIIEVNIHFMSLKVCHQSDTNGALMSRQLQEAAFPWKHKIMQNY
jgi:hypothetical protein